MRIRVKCTEANFTSSSRFKTYGRSLKRRDSIHERNRIFLYLPTQSRILCFLYSSFLQSILSTEASIVVDCGNHVGGSSTSN